MPLAITTRPNPAALAVKGRGWLQESYESGDPDMRKRASMLRKLGYRVTTVSMGSQVTPVGTVKMTMLDVRPGTTGDEYLEDLPPAQVVRWNPKRRNKPPTIHVYGEKDEWTYSIDDGHGGYIHFPQHLRFSSAKDAARHGLEHVGLPGYGGESQTLDWKHAKVKIHREGWEPAGIYALGPSSGARWITSTAKHEWNNPQRPSLSKRWNVDIPATKYDRGYRLTISATTKHAAKEAARRYCAKTYAKLTGKPQKSYRLPRSTKIAEVR